MQPIVIIIISMNFFPVGDMICLLINESSVPFFSDQMTY